jgi:hypothetical protein
MASRCNRRRPRPARERGSRARDLEEAALQSGFTRAKAVSLPAEHLQGSVGFITGRIGQREARLFEQRMPQHALAIELLQHAGQAEEFTADASVKITDRHGHTVLDTKAGGPFLMVDLPSGQYSIAATLKHR